MNNEIELENMREQMNTLKKKLESATQTVSTAATPCAASSVCC